jgi:hypothetical protein
MMLFYLYVSVCTIYIAGFFGLNLYLLLKQLHALQPKTHHLGSQLNHEVDQCNMSIDYMKKSMSS